MCKASDMAFSGKITRYYDRSPHNGFCLAREMLEFAEPASNQPGGTMHSLPQRLHQNPGQIPPEVPNIPAPQPEIEPVRSPEPEVSPLPDQPSTPEGPSGPEITPDPGYPEAPQPTEGAGRHLH
jgi:hypothetical protein